MLCPTYDHGTSLGRELGDEVRLARLATRDRGFSVAAFCQRCTNRFTQAADGRRHSPLSTFRTAAAARPAAAAAWLQRLSSLSEPHVEAAVRRAGSAVMSEASTRFALAMVSNQSYMLLEG